MQCIVAPVGALVLGWLATSGATGADAAGRLGGVAGRGKTTRTPLRDAHAPAFCGGTTKVPSPHCAIAFAGGVAAAGALAGRTESGGSALALAGARTGAKVAGR